MIRLMGVVLVAIAFSAGISNFASGCGDITTLCTGEISGCGNYTCTGSGCYCGKPTGSTTCKCRT